MEMVDMHDAQANLAPLLKRVQAGEVILISRAGELVAKLVAISKPPVKPRIPGSWKGQIQIAGDFDAPLPNQVVGPDELAPPTPGNGDDVEAG